MSVETEFVFLADATEALRVEHVAEKIEIYQAFITRRPEKVIRIRKYGNTRVLTIKGKSSLTKEGALTRTELEWDISLEEFAWLNHVTEKGAINKTRYLLDVDGNIWELDVFHGDNNGLVLAELEVPTGTARPTMPSWVLADVSGDYKYTNAELSKYPFKCWGL